MAIELDGAICTILPQEIVIHPNRKTGREITITQVDQEVTRQYYLLGLKLPFRLRVAFSDIASIALNRTDVAVYRGTSLEEKVRWSLISWNVSEPQFFVGEERPGFRHNIVLTTNQGKSITIASGTITWEGLEKGATISPGIEELERRLRQMGQLPQTV